MNRICPICNKPFVRVDGLYLCKDDELYADPKMTSASYQDDYLLHYKLYARTQKSNDICQARWDFLAHNIPFAGKTLLDYGCGADAFNTWWRQKYPKLYSYDPYFKLDHSFLNVDIDILTFWDSLEHMSRLGIVPLINAKHIFISLPVVDDVKDITTWKHFVPHEHLWYFTTKALTRLFEGWEYELVETSIFETMFRSQGIKSFYFRKFVVTKLQNT